MFPLYFKKKNQLFISFIYWQTTVSDRYNEKSVSYCVLPVAIVHFFYWPWNNKPTSKRADSFIYSVCKKIKVFWNALFPVSSLILKMCLSGALPCIFLQVYRMMSLWSFPEISSYFCPEFHGIILLFLCICFPHCFMLLEDKSTWFFTLTFPQHLSLHLICQSWILTCGQISRTPVMIS